MPDGSEARNLARRISELDPALVPLAASVLGGLESSEPHRQLYNLVSGYGADEVLEAVEVLQGLIVPVEESLNPGSNLVGPGFSAAFKRRIRAHHASHNSPLMTTSFESALELACRAEGMAVESAPSRTTRFWDVKVDGERWSAKSTAAKGLKPNEIFITKLCEASWIQDCRSPAQRHARTLELFEEFVATVNRWIILRAFRHSGGGTFSYELVEIPMSLFAMVKHLPVSEFDKENSTASVHDDQGLALQVSLDRSDSKVAIRKIPKDRCIVHAQWVYNPAAGG